MKVLHVATSDTKGGASKAAFRLHHGLKLNNIDSTLFVESKSSNDSSVKSYSRVYSLTTRINSICRGAYLKFIQSFSTAFRPKGYEVFSSPRSKYGDSFSSITINFDVINLHWVAGFFDYLAFFSNNYKHKAIVWTLHDMNPFTGGCHYSSGCNGYRSTCGACPQLSSNKKEDLSYEYLKEKLSAISSKRKLCLHLVAPSNWLAVQAKSSALFREFPVTVIPNGVDTNIFYPRDVANYRESLSIPSDLIIIGFVADTTRNRRKGFNLLKESIASIKNKNICLVSVGLHAPEIDNAAKHVHLGVIKNDFDLSRVYSLFDIYVCSSIEDNLPNTVLESFACGTPVVAFNIGGLPDMVEPNVTGILAREISSYSLANSINEILSDTCDIKSMGLRSREKALTDYTLQKQANSYSALYQSILNS